MMVMMMVMMMATMLERLYDYDVGVNCHNLNCKSVAAMIFSHLLKLLLMLTLSLMVMIRMLMMIMTMPNLCSARCERLRRS